MTDRTEILFELPWDIVDQCNGFGLDFGGSVCKVVYLHKDDWLENGKRQQDKVNLRCVNIARNEFEDGLKYLKERVCIRRHDANDKPSIFTTGIGGSQYAKKIRETFDIDTNNITEVECFTAAFHYMLENFKIKQLVHELDRSRADTLVTKTKAKIKLFDRFTEDASNFTRKEMTGELKFAPEEPMDTDKKFTDFKDLFPCFVAMIGSAGCVFLMQEDGSYRFATDMKRSGRPFIGLGSILSGAKSYDEIMDKAEKGNMRNVHEYVSDTTHGVDSEGDDKDNLYGLVAEMEKERDEPMFLFGKCVSKDIDDFRKEDLARSLLFYTVGDMVQTIHDPLRIYKDVKHCFFAGGFPNHELTRDMMFEEWLKYEGMNRVFLGDTNTHHIHFLKHGAFCGALGAYLNPKLKFKTLEGGTKK